jgi:hypothetical protein
MANTPIGQFSGSAPAIVSGGVPQLYHMVFVANEASRALLYATSPDGLNWNRGPDLIGQSAAKYCAPALGYFDVATDLSGATAKLLVAVYVSNNNEQNILWTSLDPQNSGGGWSGPFNINESSNAGVTLAFTGTPPLLTPTLYFVAHNNTHALLETTAANRWPPTFA